MSEQEYLAIIGSNIRLLIEKKNISQAELGRRLNVSAQAVSNWINGNTSIRMDKIDKMCEVFNCSRSDILEKHTESKEFDGLMKRLMAAGGKLPKESLEPFVLALEAAARACEKRQ